MMLRPRHVLAGVALLVLILFAAYPVTKDLGGAPTPTAFDRIRACLEHTKGLQVTSPTGDPLADSADEGALRTTIEGNEVTLSSWAPSGFAGRAADHYRELSPADLSGRLKRRGTLLYLWAAPASPTQRQVMYDCGG